MKVHASDLKSQENSTSPLLSRRFTSTTDQTELILIHTLTGIVNSDKATYEIQFGSVERPVHKNTSWESAKFEVCAHKYIDYADYGYGVSLLNDCKYGHNIENGTMKLSMFKCPTYPDPQADKGDHFFTYSLFPHAGNFRESGTVQLAYELNCPLKAFEIGAQEGTSRRVFIHQL